MAGEWLVAPKLNRLMRNDGKTVRLEPKVMQVLVCLAEHSGEVVSREELFRAVWPDTFVTDDVLKHCISELRKAVADDRTAPRFIETIPRGGYRLVAPVSEAQAQAQRGWTRRTRQVWLLAGLGILIVAGFASVLLRDRVVGGLRAPGPLRVVRFTTGGVNGMPAFSPDGNHIAYIHSDNGINPNVPYNVFVQSVGAPAKVQVTRGDDAYGRPTWSPDGLYIAYWQRSKTADQLMVVAAVGGTPRKVYSATETGGGGRLSWSPDGEWIAFTDAVASGAGNAPPKSSPRTTAIYLISLKDSSVRQLTYPEHNLDGDLHPIFSHDGRWLAFHRAINYAIGDLHVVEVKSGNVRRLTSDAADCSGIAWSADDKWIVYASTKGTGTPSVSALWRVSPFGGPSEPVPDANFNAWQVAIAPKGQRMAYVRGEILGRIWRVAIGSPSTVAETVFPDSDAQEGQPDLSSDGKRIVFSSQRSGHAAIWTADADGSRPMFLVDVNNGGTPRWSPDGRWIVYDNRPGAASEIEAVDAQGGTPRRLTDANAENMTPSWSRDSRWIYFASNRSGAWQVWKVPVEGGAATQVTRNGGLHALESADGKYIYFDKPKPGAGINVEIEGGIWRLPVSGGPEKLVLSARDGPQTWHWTVSKNAIYWLHTDGDQVRQVPVFPVPQIRRYDFATERITVVGHSPAQVATAAWINPNVVISPDERWLLYSVVTNSPGDIMLVENFR